MNSVYKTKDLYLASFLLASGFENYTIEKNNSIVYFIFEPNDDDPKKIINIEIDNYWQNNSLVNTKKLFNAYKELRLRINLS